MPKPPVLPDQKPAVNVEDRMLKINPEVNQRLDAYIQANQKTADYYRNLVKADPDRAFRTIMMNKMYRDEAQVRVAERQAPQAKEWLEKQDPNVQQRIADRIAKLDPANREKAFVAEVAKEKTRLDFSPKAAKGLSTS